ncbi:alpha-N-arabinofuranosidase [Arachidicoccus ginsenosidivorans]|uniref:non-reducing end alpha-L-arabinofuranosidase n=2 Tax=Arachidicoccus ginsenosidivorans TaxID=496057 RepID=A0A5B8VSV1_9BACT|nr:alpha-N-arabinofuranosidase [Arachidicoccus ginsenosidivorans]
MSVFAQSTPSMAVNLDKVGHEVSPMLYGLMTEEINYAYDGGIYAEIIRNRSFQDDRNNPVHWSLFSEKQGGTIKLDHKTFLNRNNPVSLMLDVPVSENITGIANDGFWGVPVKPATVYKGFFYAKADFDGDHRFSVSIRGDSADPTVYATAIVKKSGADWNKYSFELTTKQDIKPTSNARFVITTAQKGRYWFSVTSLFPPTFRNTPNGNRPDIMQLLSDMKPAFLRLPGGNFLEGGKFSSRYDWKKTLGPLENRPGHMGTWGYRASDGMGLLEYLRWCEDLNMEPLLAVFAGYTLGGDHLEGAYLQPFIDEALDEIEYVIGDVNTKWGAQRAKDGHPKAFPLRYIEIGNEDFFDRSGSYKERFAQFYKAIKTKYPQMTIISTSGKEFDVPGGKADMIDDHYYRNASEMEGMSTQYDDYDRNGPKVIVGEWATREGSPTPNFNAALGDAAWLTGLERNSDVVLMSCYAPLFVNVNPGGMQWKSDLIGYNALNSYGSPSYYVQKMFSNHLGDKYVPIQAENIPTQFETLNEKDIASGRKPRKIPAMFYVATKDSKKKLLYLKLVNTQNKAQKVNIDITGTEQILPAATLVELSAMYPEATNSIKEPTNIVPVKSDIRINGNAFTRELPAYSIAVIVLKIK